MKQFLFIFILSFLNMHNSYAGIGVCGGDISRFLVRDILYFDDEGDVINATADTTVQKRHKVDFSYACNEHDTCYGTKGRSKFSCDTDFYRNLKSACNHQLKATEKVFKSCINEALLYNDAVRGQATRHTNFGDFQSVPFTGNTGCKAYIKGQKKAGVADPSCEKYSSSVTKSSSNTEVNKLEPKTVESNSMINIDSPTDLKVNCDSKRPAFTDIVISVNGLEQNKAYTLLLKGYNGGSRYIYPRRTSEPKILYEGIYAGRYEAQVWFQKGNIKNQKLLASKTLNITRHEPKISAKEKVVENTPFEVSVSDVIAPKQRYIMLLTIVPKYYPLNKLGDRKTNIRNCEPINHTFKGLSKGLYELRLLHLDNNETTLLASKEISVLNVY